jgi:NodT family efflux transporter outer membrane factor (OMF) lipoprotein
MIRHTLLFATAAAFCAALSAQEIDYRQATFGDSLLQELMLRAEAENFSLKQAARSVAMSQLTLRSTRAGYFPVIGAEASYGRERSTKWGLTASATLSWEVDVFGRIAAQSRGDKASVELSRAEARGVMLSLMAEVATDYVQLRTAQRQLIVALEHAESQRSAMEIARARHEAGLASQLDVSEAEAVYFTTLAGVPQLQATIDKTLNALTVLTSAADTALIRRLAEPQPLPEAEQPVPAAVDMSLLMARPDVVQALRQIEVYAAQMGVERKAYLPHLQLSGSIGVDRGDFAYSMAPTLTWTLFDGLARRYAVASAREQMLSATDAYELTVLTAVEETRSALADYRYTLRRIAVLQDAVDASRRAQELAIEKYRGGLTAFINVADAQITYLENRNSLIAARGNALTALITLWKAVGGNFLSTP